MADSASNSPSRSSTPAANSSNSTRFLAQSHTAEDLLKEQTVGLVHLSDFRKRRAEAIDQVSRDVTPGAGSGASTPREGREPDIKSGIGFKKRKKAVKKGGLSFGNDDEEEGVNGRDGSVSKPTISANDGSATPADDSDAAPPIKKKALRPNVSVNGHPKAMTKSALLRDAQLKESLRKEFLQIQEAVKATEFCLPFVFFDGKDQVGGVCRMKKGEHVWLFLDKARKVGAASATGGGGGRRDWARIGVDDLMLVKGDLIVPHHYDFHHFILNKTTGYNNTPLFPYSAEPTSATPQHLLNSSSSSTTPEPAADSNPHLKTATQRRVEASEAAAKISADSELEGFSDEPALTKVVDRRWYERNKHIYPASVWEEFEEGKDYSSSGGRKDKEGNAFFYSR